tara:strand:+ start:1432 stop:1578 length:147 start_codon:yes stop_codon:yes gene_type:complete
MLTTSYCSRSGRILGDTGPWQYLVLIICIGVVIGSKLGLCEEATEPTE